MRFDPKFVHVATTLDNGVVRVTSFITEGRGTVLPFGAQWKDNNPDRGIWIREPTNVNIFEELGRVFAEGPQPTRFRLLPGVYTPRAEAYNDCRLETDGVISYDMVAARNVRLSQLRNERALRFQQLDADWMRAIGQNQRSVADAIEAQREQLRNMPTTIRAALDAAQTPEQLALVVLPV